MRETASRADAYGALLGGTAANAVASAVVIAVEVGLFAVLVRLLDAATYGLLIVAAGLAGQFAFLDLGLARGLERFLPEFRATGRGADGGRALAFTLVLHALIGLAVAAAIAVLAALGGGEALAPGGGEAMTTLLWIVAAFTVPSWALACTGSALVGLGRLPTEAAVQASAALLRAAVLIVCALRDVPLAWLLTAALAVELCAGALRLVLVLRAIEGPVLTLDAATRRIGREMLGYSSWVGAQRFVVSVSNGFDRLIVSALLGPAAVPAYWLCMRLIRVAPGLVGSVAKRAVMPVAAGLHAAGGDGELHDLVRRGTRAYTAFMLAIVALLVVYATPILALLGGVDVANWAWAVQLSLLLQALVVSRGVLAQAAIIKTETARDSAVVGLVLAVLHVGMLAMAGLQDALGAAIVSWSLAHLLLAPWWIQRMARQISFPTAAFYGAALRGGWPAAVFVVIHLPLVGLLDGLGPVELMISGGASALIAAALAWGLGLDRDLRRALLARTSRRRHPRA